MIDKLYGKYFQKSRSFLYPALGIRRTGTYSPTGTYISIHGVIPPEDVRLICTFKKETSDKFNQFEQDMIIENPLFLEKITTDSDFNVYVFSLENSYEADFFNVILGKYSRLSTPLKRAIKQYFGEKSLEYKYIETYLYPDRFFDNYSSLLGIDTDTLKRIGELCDPIDLEKECLVLPSKDLIIFE